MSGIHTTGLGELTAAESPRYALLDRDTLILCTGGHGTIEIDFRAHPFRPGTLAWIRPGQAVRHDGGPDLDAVVVHWSTGDVPPTLPGSRTGSGPWQLTGEDEDAVISEVSQLVVDCRRHGAARAGADLLRHQLAVLLLRVVLLADGEPVDADSTYQRLCREMERSYQVTRRVEDYARLLGCSVRTLTRACLAATGRSAKQVIDNRVALQAMRLLAATDIPIADLGRRLGFPVPTNFGRCFAREVGLSPGSFRAGRSARLDREPAGTGHRPENRPLVPGGDTTPPVPQPGRVGRPAAGLTGGELTVR